MKFNRSYVLLVIVFVLGVVFPGGVQTGNAQSPQPPEPLEEPARSVPTINGPCVSGEPCQDSHGKWYISATPAEIANNKPSEIGDTDEYGYTLTSTTYSWLDATNGTNLELTGYDQKLVDLPFDFPFYENTYSKVYVAAPGYLTFDDQYVKNQSQMPNESEPNNVIAPYWAPNDYVGNGGTGRAFYKFGGSAPNRYLLVEYNKLSDHLGNDFTFEIQLFENGNIKFQYNQINVGGSYYCAEAGIEDSNGLDGVTLSLYCGGVPQSHTAVLFTRPAPGAQVRAYPLKLGGFTSSQSVDDFTFTLTNTGDLGVDTYDMVITTAPLGGGWDVELFNKDTGMPLTDTDGDGMIDSSSLAEGASKEIIVRVSAPAGLTTGDNVKTFIDITSSLNTAKTKTVTIESTVPAAFAQTYGDYRDGTLKTDLIWSSTKMKVDVATDAWNIYDPVIIETPDHNFVNVWSDIDWYDENTWGYTLRYAVVDGFGQIVKAPTVLSSIHEATGYYTAHSDISLAVTSDGKVGIVWGKYISDPNDWENYNIWFAMLTSTGSLAQGPVNLTNDNTWGDYYSGTRVIFSDSDISASENYRFMVTWKRWTEINGKSDIYYTIRQSSGAVVVPVTAMTASTGYDSQYYPSVQIALNGNRFFIIYRHSSQLGEFFYSEILYKVLDSNGSILKPETQLDIRAPLTAVQLSGGNIFLAGRDYRASGIFVAYQILNSTNFGLISEGTLNHESGEPSSMSISVSRDANNRGIITWSDENYRYLYYSLIFGTNGAVLTNPVIFYRSDHPDGISLSYNGSSVTTNSWMPLAGVDLIASFSGDLFGGAPGGLVPVKMNYLNSGLTTATSIELALTLPVGLTYNHDTSGMTPVIDGNTITWTLDDLPFAGNGEFQVYLAIDSDAVIGTMYPISLEISSAGVDTNPSDNTDSAQVFAAIQCYLPLLQR